MAYRRSETPFATPITRARFIGGAFVLISTGGLLAACGGAEKKGEGATSSTVGTTTDGKTPAAPSKLRVRLTQPQMNLDAALIISQSDLELVFNIYEGLLTYKPGSFELVNSLAEEFKSSDDGLTHTFKLKEGVPFHGDYGEVTAEDVKFSYERIAGLTKPKIEATFQNQWAALREVKLTGTYTGTILLKEPFGPLTTLTLPIFSGLIVSTRAVEERGKDFRRKPIGTGPYEVAEYVANQRVVLKRFSDYGGALDGYAARPIWDEIACTVIVEDSAAEIALETNEIDYGLIPLSSVERFQQNKDFTVVETPSLYYEWLSMNVQHPKLRDIRVRQAIRSAIDVPSIIEAAYEGKATQAYAIVAAGMPVGFWKDAPRYERDVEKAKSLLDQAGIKSLDLELAVTNTEIFRAVAQVIQANLADVGINIKINTLDDASFNEIQMGDKALSNLQLAYVSYGASPDPGGSTIWFTCEQVKVWNYMEWCNPEFDRLHAEALQELDPTKRTDLYIHMQQLMDEDAVAVWVAHPNRYTASKANIKQSIYPDADPLYWAFTAA
jgi:peptide/nickel transport system substrate-binding protein